MEQYPSGIYIAGILLCLLLPHNGQSYSVRVYEYCSCVNHTQDKRAAWQGQAGRQAGPGNILRGRRSEDKEQDMLILNCGGWIAESRAASPWGVVGKLPQSLSETVGNIRTYDARTVDVLPLYCCCIYTSTWKRARETGRSLPPAMGRKEG